MDTIIKIVMYTCSCVALLFRLENHIYFYPLLYKSPTSDCEDNSCILLHNAVHKILHHTLYSSGHLYIGRFHQDSLEIKQDLIILTPYS